MARFREYTAEILLTTYLLC